MTAVLLAVVATTFSALAWRDFRFALIALFGLLPTYLLRFSVGPIPSTLLEAFILILATIWFVRNPRVLATAFHGLGRWRMPLLLVLAAACIAASYAPDVWTALGILKAYYVEPALVVLMLRTTFTSTDDWRRAGIALATSGIVVACIALLQYVSDVGIPAPWDLERRTTSIYDFPNAVGLFLAPVSSMVIVTLMTRQFTNRKAITCAVGAFLLMLGAILTSKTEAALVAMPTAIVLTLLMSKLKPSTKICGVAVFVVLAASAYGASGAVREKLLLQDVSGQARVAMWRETVTMLSDHPLLGAGLSGYPTALAPYHDPKFYEIFQYPHNILLNIWVELGLLGVVVATLFAALVVHTTWQHRADPLVLAGFAALLTMAIHGLVDVPFFKNDLAVMTAGFLALLMTRDNPTTT